MDIAWLAQEPSMEQNSRVVTIPLCKNNWKGVLGKGKEEALRACLAQLPSVKTTNQHLLSAYCVSGAIPSAVTSVCSWSCPNTLRQVLLLSPS